MKFEQKQIQVDDTTISYLDEGKKQGEPLIFIHGFPFNKLMWENQIEVLKENYRAIAYDVRGHGASEVGTEEISIQQFAKDLFLFMDALKIEKAMICGLSMGGYIALNAIQHQSSRITALILCNTQCLADNFEAKTKRMDTIKSIQEKGLAEYARESVKKLFSKTSHENKKEEVAFIENTILDTSKESICNTLMALAERTETCSTLYLIDIPVLIIAGEEDQVIPLEIVKKMHDLFPNSVFHTISHAGHLSNLENPESFNGHVEDFLSKFNKGVN